MNYSLILTVVAIYFALLLIISIFTSRRSKHNAFFDGDKKSPWFVVAFGMIGATLSGVTFISVPGEVGNSSFHYFQFVLGNFVGYLFIANVLLPFYYRKKVVSIYSVLEKRAGRSGYLTTSGFFILSKLIGASFRLFLAAMVLQMAIAKPLNIPFGITVLVCLVVIWLYTFRSGIKTVVWTDTLQTFVLIGSVIATLVVLFQQINQSPFELISNVFNSPKSDIWDWEWKSSNNFFKQFFSGIFIAIALNGLDQDIVQKNLTCRDGRTARKNMMWFSLLFVITVFLFLFLGAVIYLYASSNGIAIPEKTDQLFPFIALNHLGTMVQVLFVLGVTAAAFSSADSATTALTTAFCYDFLDVGHMSYRLKKQKQMVVHLAFFVVLYGIIMMFYQMHDQSVVVTIFKAAGYTYGPILGIFLFSFFVTGRRFPRFVLLSFILSPALTYLCEWATNTYTDYRFGFELIILNAFITLVLLTLFSKRWK